MGYSIAVHVKSKKEKEKMLSFLNQEFRSLPILFGEDPIIFKKMSRYRIDDVVFSENLAYDHHKDLIGCDYSTMTDWNSYYIYSILKWVAIKIGQDHSFGEGKLKALIYDGEEKFPIYTKEEQFKYTPEEYKYTVNELGFHPFRSLLSYSLPDDMGFFSKISFNVIRFIDKKINKTEKLEQALSRIVKLEIERLESQYKKIK